MSKRSKNWSQVSWPPCCSSIDFFFLARNSFVFLPTDMVVAAITIANWSIGN